MAKTPKFPSHQYGYLQEEGTADEYLSLRDQILEIVYDAMNEGETKSIAVYKLEKIIKVKKEGAFKIVG